MKMIELNAVRMGILVIAVKFDEKFRLILTLSFIFYIISL